MQGENMNLSQKLSKLPERWQWTLHNLLAHPLSEIFYQLGFIEASNLLHDLTIPDHKPGTGRG